MKKRLLSLLLAALMIVTMLPVTVMAENLPNNKNESGDGWSWDYDTETLTLDGLSESGNFNFHYDGGDLTIILKGNNTLTTTGADGIYCKYGNLTIQGPGSLTVSSGQEDKGNWCAAIATLGKLTITDGATVHATGGNGSRAHSYGIYGANGVTIKNATVTAKSGTATGDGRNSVAIGSTNSGAEVLIENATVTAIAGEAADYSCGIFSEHGTVLIQNVTGTQFVKTNSGKSNGKMSDGIYSAAGVTIKDAKKVEATAGPAGGRNGDSIGIGSGAGILIDNSNVTATGNSAGDFSSGIHSNNGTITIRNKSFVTATGQVGSSCSCGICAQSSDGNVVIAASHVIASADTTYRNYHAIHFGLNLNYTNGYAYRNNSTGDFTWTNGTDNAYQYNSTDAYLEFASNAYTLNYDLNYEGASPKVVTVRAAGGPDYVVNDWVFMVDEGYYTTPLAGKLDREGYTFLGWAETSAGPVKYAVGNESNNKITLTANVPTTLYAVWEPAYTYTLIYNGNGGGWTSEETTKTVSAKLDNAGPVENWKFNSETAAGIAYPGDPTRDNYTFLGWAESKNATTAEWSKTDATNNAISLYANTPKTIYAVWKLNTTDVTITYAVKTNGASSNLKGGTVSRDSETVTDIGTTSATGSTATANAGYNFNGWTKGTDTTVISTAATYAPDRSDGKYTEETYYANFSANTDTKYTVQHFIQNLAGNGYTLHSTDTTRTGSTDTEVDAVSAGLVKSIEHFTYDSSVAGTVASGTIKGDGTLVLKLYYKRNTYTVTFVDEDGTTKLGEQSYPYGTPAATVQTYANTLKPTKEADVEHTYTFEKWTPSITDVTGDITYTAVYKTDTRKYDLTYDANGGYVTENSTSSTVVDQAPYGNNYALRTASPFSHAGTTATPSIPIVWFGWSETDNSEKIYSKTDECPTIATTVNITGNKTVYALWGLDTNKNGTADVLENTYTLNYDANGGVDSTMPTDSNKYLTKNQVTLTETGNEAHNPEDEVPVVFIGWSAEKANKIYAKSDIITAGTLVESVTFDASSITVYAVWGYDTNNNGKADVLEDQYTVTYTDGVDGETVFADQVTEGLLYGNATPAFNGTPSRKGYTFQGWEPEVTATVTRSVTYVAQWEKNRIWFPTIVVGGPTITVEGLNTEDHVAYVVGRGNHLFVPYGTVTRAEAATMYFRLLTEDFRNYYWDDDASYSDVKSSDWFHVAVATLEAAGVIQDTPAYGKFRPNEPITRAEMAVMAAQFCKVSGKVADSSFRDVSSSYWAADEIAVVECAGFIQGYNGYYRPDDTITRAECVTIINRMLERGAEAENMLPGMVTFTDVTADAWYYEAVQEAANSHTYDRSGFLMTNERFYGEFWRTLEKAPDWAALEQLWAANR